MQRRTTKLEICCQDLASVRAALNAGAHRIELCTALDCGGLTPSYGLITAAVNCAANTCECSVADNSNAECKLRTVEAEQVPIMVLVRPRAGGFVYSHGELQVMCADIRAARTAGAQGVVFGCLKFAGDGLGGGGNEGRNSRGTDAESEDEFRNSHTVRKRRLVVDKEAMDILLGVVAEAKWSLGASPGGGAIGVGNGKVTFHRAFDDVDDPLQTLDDIMALNAASDGHIKRILTSGLHSTAEEGIQVLRQMCEHTEQAGAGMSIMPGAGVTKANARKIVQQTGCWEIHASAKRVFTTAEDESRLFRMESMAVTDEMAVEGILAVLVSLDGE